MKAEVQSFMDNSTPDDRFSMQSLPFLYFRSPSVSSISRWGFRRVLNSMNVPSQIFFLILWGTCSPTVSWMLVSCVGVKSIVFWEIRKFCTVVSYEIWGNVQSSTSDSLPDDSAGENSVSVACRSAMTCGGSGTLAPLCLIIGLASVFFCLFWPKALDGVPLSNFLLIKYNKSKIWLEMAK